MLEKNLKIEEPILKYTLRLNNKCRRLSTKDNREYKGKLVLIRNYHKLGRFPHLLNVISDGSDYLKYLISTGFKFKVTENYYIIYDVKYLEKEKNYMIFKSKLDGIRGTYNWDKLYRHSYGKSWWFISDTSFKI